MFIFYNGVIRLRALARAVQYGKHFVVSLLLVRVSAAHIWFNMTISCSFMVWAIFDRTLKWENSLSEKPNKNIQYDFGKSPSRMNGLARCLCRISVWFEIWMLCMYVLDIFSTFVHLCFFVRVTFESKERERYAWVKQRVEEERARDCRQRVRDGRESEIERDRDREREKERERGREREREREAEP